MTGETELSIQNDPRMAQRDSGKSQIWYMKDHKIEL